ncbi:MAG: hypothetical protein U0136_03975 [Bdellovibrionota bacterium]
MVNRKICYLTYSTLDLDLVVPRILSDVSAGDAEVHLVIGFHYDELTNGRLEPVLQMEGLCTSRLVPDWHPSRHLTPPGRTRLEPSEYLNTNGLIGTTLAEELSARYDWSELAKQVECAEQALENLLVTLRPDLVVLPEESDYIRGALACECCRCFGVRTEVYYSRYHNRFASYPRLVEGGSERYFVRDNALSNVLVAQGVARSKIEKIKDPALTASPQTTEEAELDLLFVLQNNFWEPQIIQDLGTLTKASELRIGFRQHPRAFNKAAAATASQFPKLIDLSAVEAQRSLIASRVVLAHSSHLLEVAKTHHVRTAGIDYSGFPPELDQKCPSAPTEWIRNRNELRELLASL